MKINKPVHGKTTRKVTIFDVPGKKKKKIDFSEICSDDHIRVQKRKTRPLTQFLHLQQFPREIFHEMYIVLQLQGLFSPLKVKRLPIKEKYD